MAKISTALNAGTTSYGTAPNLRASAADGVEYAYRDVGEPAGRTLVLLQHFRGTSTTGTRPSSTFWRNTVA